MMPQLERIQTGCNALDLLTNGGLPTGTITQIFGEKALGKSILSLQAAYSTVAGGNSAIILDTEQSTSATWSATGGPASRRGSATRSR